MQLFSEIVHKKYEPITMLKVSINLFVKLFVTKNPKECLEFLLEQFLITSECDTNPMEDEVCCDMKSVNVNYKNL